MLYVDTNIMDVKISKSHVDIFVLHVGTEVCHIIVLSYFPMALYRRNYFVFAFGLIYPIILVTINFLLVVTS